MARPSVWRWEFQQVENEYINYKGRVQCSTTLGQQDSKELQVSVARAQHRGKTGRLHLATATFAWLLKMTMVAHFLQSALPIDLFLQAPQRLIDRFAFF